MASGKREDTGASTRGHYVENWLWKGLWSCTTDCWIIIIIIIIIIIKIANVSISVWERKWQDVRENYIRRIFMIFTLQQTLDKGETGHVRMRSASRIGL